MVPAVSRGFEDLPLGPVTRRCSSVGGKAERFNRALPDERTYQRSYASKAERTAALDSFLHTYNRYRCHTHSEADPTSRTNNAPSQYT